MVSLSGAEGTKNCGKVYPTVRYYQTHKPAQSAPYLRHTESREGGEHLPAPGMVRTRQFEHHPSLYSLGQAERGKGHGADELVIVRDKAS